MLGMRSGPPVTGSGAGRGPWGRDAIWDGEGTMGRSSFPPSGPALEGLVVSRFPTTDTPGPASKSGGAGASYKLHPPVASLAFFT